MSLLTPNSQSNALFTQESISQSCCCSENHSNMQKTHFNTAPSTMFAPVVTHANILSWSLAKHPPTKCAICQNAHAIWYSVFGNSVNQALSFYGGHLYPVKAIVVMTQHKISTAVAQRPEVITSLMLKCHQPRVKKKRQYRFPLHKCMWENATWMKSGRVEHKGKTKYQGRQLRLQEVAEVCDSHRLNGNWFKPGTEIMNGQCLRSQRRDAPTLSSHFNPKASTAPAGTSRSLWLCLHKQPPWSS